MANTNTVKNPTAKDIREAMANYEGNAAPKLVRAYRDAERRGDMRYMKRIRAAFGRVHNREFRCPEDNIEFEMMLLMIGEAKNKQTIKEVDDLCLSTLRL